MQTKLLHAEILYIYILNLLQTRNKKKKKKGKNAFQPKPGFYGISSKCLPERESNAFEKSQSTKQFASLFSNEFKMLL
jgi:hypothetical protein